MKMVKVASFANRVQAGMAAGLLEMNGIAHAIRGDDVGIFGPGHAGPSVLGVDLLVGEGEAAEAVRLLTEAGFLG